MVIVHCDSLDVQLFEPDCQSHSGRFFAGERGDSASRPAYVLPDSFGSLLARLDAVIVSDVAYIGRERGCKERRV
jgi:hypothetical protein